MTKLIDKLIILIFCVAFYMQNVNNIYFVVPFFIAIIISSLNSYFDNEKFKIVAFLVYTIICMNDSHFIFFIPLLAYDILISHNELIALYFVLQIFSNLPKTSILINISIFMFIVVTYLLKYRTTTLEKTKSEFIKLRDSTKELSSSLENKNKELLDKQEYEINLATLNERNRIAREIHDNVGHLLSSSILQIGALLATTKDKNTEANLTTLKDTLSVGMDSIRNNIHNLHDESIDLYSQISSLVNSFTFCNITLDYDIKSNMTVKLKYCFISVIKEALSNIIKHSNATKVNITLREHPAIFQLYIQDNGDKRQAQPDNGIGLNNIVDRITGLNGNINIDYKNGFRIFISVPKEI